MSLKSMKYTYKLSFRNNIKDYLLGLILIFLISACAKQVTNPEIEKLENQKELLSLRTKLNDLNLSLEKELVKMQTLERKVKDANNESIASANEVKELTEKLNKNPGDSKLASKVSRASKRAAKDAEKATKLNEDLSDANKVIKSYQDDIEDVKSDLEELNSEIKIIPKESN